MKRTTFTKLLFLLVFTLVLPVHTSADSFEESTTSLLGHLNDETVKIYKTIGNESTAFEAGTTYTSTVYYIKKQAVSKSNNQRYYLISTRPSSTTGVVGWVKSTDMDTRTHVGVDKKSKQFYIKGTGSAYSKAWGGEKDLVYEDLSSFATQEFQVNLTEKVGNNTWYRGSLNGKTVWIHSSYVSTKVESTTSRLGHIRSSSVKIYKSIGNESTAVQAGTTYTNVVYYIKKQAVIGSQTYYLISKKPSSTNGVVGWVKSSDLTSYAHTTVDKASKTFYIKGTGSAYSKAWGGKKDLVYEDLSSYAIKEFQVHLTEKVGNNTWYRGNLNGKTVWIHSSYVSTKVESTTSRLGHINGSSVKIYQSIGNESSAIQADTAYTNAVYYIKKQAVIGDQTFYLISQKPSSTNGVVGWVKSSDLTSYAHTTVDKASKTFYIKGTGSAYSKVWGGEKDLVYETLSSYAIKEFQVNLTENVGTDTWYRGSLDGKTVWIHSSNVLSKEESTTSRLGHIKSSSVKIYQSIGNESSAIQAGTTYTNAVYYIKRQAVIGDQTFYLISQKPSSTNGVVGWVNADNLTSYTHTTVDKASKTFYIKGTGSSYAKAWGGKKDYVYSSLSPYKNQKFNVHLTEKVGENIWYRGTLGGKTTWIHQSYLNEKAEIDITYTEYNLTLGAATNIQMTASPQTDKEYNAYVSKSYINSSNEVTATTLNVRGGPSSNYWVIGQLKQGDIVTILGEVNGWYQIKYTENLSWVNASPDDVSYYLNPNNFVNDSKQMFQFLDLSKPSEVSASALNSYLKGKGTLEGMGQAFIDASAANGINDIYLVSHALLETGNGNSTLAKGVSYNGVTVYNFFGIGAYDGSAITSGAKKAYEEGWTTPYKAIVGGAKFIGSGYINNGLNTLYKMRWNPEAMATNGRYGKQYATDIGWAYKQVTTMYNLYQQIGDYVLYLDVPVYK